MPAVLRKVMSGHVPSAVLRAVAVHRIADHRADGPRTPGGSAAELTLALRDGRSPFELAYRGLPFEHQHKSPEDRAVFDALTVVEGRERAAAESGELPARAGFRPHRIRPTPAPPS
ncbi:hypothetical protein PL81_02370, partial [Streptomyces sp. RSD-27]